MAWRIDAVASESDIDAIVAIEQASFTAPWTREMHIAELANHGVSYVYVARDHASEIVGFCAFWRIGDEIHINNLAVLPSRRRSGVASALLFGILREGGRLGAGRATLEVRRSNEPARRLYERFGFRIAGVRRGYYTDPPEDAIILWREAEPVAPP